MSVPKLPPDLGILLTLGVSLAVWITGGVLLGRWADNHWAIQPWGTLTGAFVGIAGSALTVFRIVRRLDQKTQ
jgi:hypothetical protein